MADDDDKGTGTEGQTTEPEAPDTEESWKRLQGLIREEVHAGVKEELGKWQTPVQTPEGGQGQGKAPAVQTPAAPRSQTPRKQVSRIEQIMFGKQPALRQSRQGSGRRSNQEDK